MKLLSLKLLITALVVLAANSAFAAFTYNVSINTSSLAGESGYLYLQYDPFSTNTASTATVAGFVTDGTLGAQDTVDVVNGSAVTGVLPGSVVFTNTNGINDYNHAITLGSAINFSLSLDAPIFGGPSGGTTGSSTFSLGLFADASGSTPLLNTTGILGSVPGTLFTVSLLDNGTTTTEVLASEAAVTATPIPAAAWLLGSGLTGLVALRKRALKG